MTSTSYTSIFISLYSFLYNLEILKLKTDSYENSYYNNLHRTFTTTSNQRFYNDSNARNYNELVIISTNKENMLNNSNVLNDKLFTMNSTDNIHPSLTKTASIEYANLFRGLSTFEMDSIPSILGDMKPSIGDPKSDQDLIKDHEKTMNLADMLLQQQEIVNATNPSVRTDMPPVKLARLNTVKDIKVETNHDDDMIHVVNREHGVESTSETSNLADSLISESMNIEKNTTNSTSSSSNKTLVNQRNREKINVKRLSTTSTTSSTASSSLNATSVTQPKRRGRKPISSNPDESRQATKKQLIIEQSKGNMVYFGNKLVEKKTDEYDKRRKNNNEAVKKCRHKLAQEQQKKEERMKELNDENIKLTNTVDQLSKELNLLKSIIAKMSPDQKLPEYLEHLIKNMEDDSS